MTSESGSSAYLEEVDERTGVEAGLLVGRGERRTLAGALGNEGGGEVELETLGKVVLSLNLSLQDVGSGPSLSEDDAVGLVGVLGLNVARDQVRLVVARARDLECDAGGGGRLDLERCRGEGVVLREQVVRRLAEVL